MGGGDGDGDKRVGGVDEEDFCCGTSTETCDDGWVTSGLIGFGL